jgi:hypothetical protein
LSKHCNGMILDLLQEERINTAHNIRLKPHSARILKYMRDDHLSQIILT